MRKSFKIFLFFLAIFIIIFFFWPFGKRSFDITENFQITFSDNGIIFPTEARAQTVSEFLAEKNIALSEHDYIFPAPETKIFPGGRIIIRRALPVAIEVDGRNIKLDTLGTNVRDAINEASIILSHADKIAPDINSLLSPTLAIKITRINFEEVVIEEDIAFQTIEKEDKTVL